MTGDEVRAELKRKCETYPSQKAFAKEIGVSGQYVADILCSKRNPGPVILKALGLVKVVTYERETG